MAPVTSAQTGWATAFPAHVATVNAAKQTNDEAGSAYVAVIRSLVRLVHASAVVSDAEKTSLGIIVLQTPTPIGTPTTAPQISVECGMRLQQTFRFVDSATATRKAERVRSLDFEIWNNVGTTPPTGENDLRFVVVGTNPPYVMNLDPAAVVVICRRRAFGATSRQIATHQAYTKMTPDSSGRRCVQGRTSTTAYLTRTFLGCTR